MYDPQTGYHYQLKGDPPVLFISGVRMQEGDPWETAKEKVGLLGKVRGRRILEVCTGLGYTTWELLRRGAEVVTIEKDENVLRLAEEIPHFAFVKERARILRGDAYEVLEDLEPSSFDGILHDPPRISMAPLLYSMEFYKRLAKVLKPGGRIVHYVGRPGCRFRGKDYQKGVMNRLREAGFTRLERRGYNVVGVRSPAGRI